MNRLQGLAIAAGLAAVLPVAANAAIVTFDDYTPVNTYTPVIDYGGLTFTGDGGLQYVWDDTTPNGNVTNNLLFGEGTVVTITRTGGGLFDLLNLNLVIASFAANPLETILVNGNPFDITTTATDYVFNLTGISSFTISALTGTDQNGMPLYWSLDNVEYEIASAPLPAGLPLLLAGLTALGLVARRRKAG